MLTKHFSIILLLLAIWPAFAGAQGGSHRLPAPEETVVKTAMPEIAKLYKKENDAAKSFPQKSELARKILADALNTTNDPVAKYTSLLIARRLAVQAGDISTIIRAAEATIIDYAVPRNAFMSDVFKEANKKIDSPEDNYFARRWLEYALSFPQEANDSPKRLIEIGVSLAKESKDKEAIEEWSRRAKELKERSEATEALTTVWEKLETTPLDAIANGKLGRQWAFGEQNWEMGIPLLALCDDQSLAALAERDLRLPTSDQDRLSLAKDWAAWGEKESEPAKTAASARGAYWYRQVVPNLTGLEKTRVEKLLAELDANSSPFAHGRWVELLDRVDFSRHVLHGGFKRNAFLVECAGVDGWDILNLPIAIDGGSYETQFCLSGFSDEIAVYFPGPEYPIELAINCWFEGKTALNRINGQEGKHTPEAVQGMKFEPRQLYFFQVRVERSGGAASYSVTVNNKKFYAWKGLESLLASDQQRYRDKLMVVAKRRQLSILSARVRLLDNGRAHLETP